MLKNGISFIIEERRPGVDYTQQPGASIHYITDFLLML